MWKNTHEEVGGAGCGQGKIQSRAGQDSVEHSAKRTSHRSISTMSFRWIPISFSSCSPVATGHSFAQTLDATHKQAVDTSCSLFFGQGMRDMYRSK